MILLPFVPSAPSQSCTCGNPSIELCLVEPSEQLHCREPTEQGVLRGSRREGTAWPCPTAPRHEGQLLPSTAPSLRGASKNLAADFGRRACFGKVYAPAEMNNS